MVKRVIEKESYNLKATKDKKNEEAEEKLNNPGTKFFILMHSVDDLDKKTNFLTNSLYNLEEEISVHCDYCEESFLSESSLRTHILHKHGKKSQ